MGILVSLKTLKRALLLDTLEKKRKRRKPKSEHKRKATAKRKEKKRRTPPRKANGEFRKRR